MTGVERTGTFGKGASSHRHRHTHARMHTDTHTYIHTHTRTHTEYAHTNTHRLAMSGTERTGTVGQPRVDDGEHAGGDGPFRTVALDPRLRLHLHMRPSLPHQGERQGVRACWRRGPLTPSPRAPQAATPRQRTGGRSMPEVMDHSLHLHVSISACAPGCGTGPGRQPHEGERHGIITCHLQYRHITHTGISLVATSVQIHQITQLHDFAPLSRSIHTVTDAHAHAPPPRHTHTHTHLADNGHSALKRGEQAHPRAQ